MSAQSATGVSCLSLSLFLSSRFSSACAYFFRAWHDAHLIRRFGSLHAMVTLSRYSEHSDMIGFVSLGPALLVCFLGLSWFEVLLRIKRTYIARVDVGRVCVFSLLTKSIVVSKIQFGEQNNIFCSQKYNFVSKIHFCSHNYCCEQNTFFAHKTHFLIKRCVLISPKICWVVVVSKIYTLLT